MGSDKRDSILETALRLFTERGFHNTPTSLIAKEADVATGTLFHHFNTKEMLINELYLELKQELMEAVKEDLDPVDPVKEKLRTIWMNGVEWGIMHPEKYQFLMQFTNSPFITKLTREEVYGQYEFLSVFYREALEKKVFKDVYLEFIQDYFEGVANCAIGHFRKYPDKISKENLNLVFDIIWNGIAAF